MGMSGDQMEGTLTPAFTLQCRNSDTTSANCWKHQGIYRSTCLGRPSMGEEGGALVMGLCVHEGALRHLLYVRAVSSLPIKTGHMKYVT